LNTKTDSLQPAQLLGANETDSTSPEEMASGRKPFVEPEVSFPVDVLEATTFFQLTDSGGLLP